jgi:thiamine-monophosphate kinase
LNEFALIARIAESLPSNDQLVQGVGDDCAVIDLGVPDRLILFKADSIVEGVHFTAETSARKAGRKALARGLSDIAAMAGTPTACLITLALPGGFAEDWVLEFYEGLNSLARDFSVAVAGGETTRSPAKIFVSIALIGTIPRGRRLSRANAKPGDAIFVSGDLGGSIAAKHLDFVPRLEEARWLAKQFPVHCMMDLSDGLAGDLRHILHASKVGAEILSSAIPISRAAKLQAKQESSAKPPLLAALTDGEDFELLFTVPAAQAVSVLDGWQKQFPATKLSCIGKITPEPGLRIRDKQGIRELAAHGFTHFQKS